MHLLAIAGRDFGLIGAGLLSSTRIWGIRAHGVPGANGVRKLAIA